ncbi:type 2A phosphatase activator Tip41p [Monosporozyma unispora]|nr:hypothetical protein C6P44_000459 [Kazachstania unispora]
MNQDDKTPVEGRRAPPGLHGIDTITINAAREMHARTVRARMPPSRRPNPPTTTTSSTTTTTTSMFRQDPGSSIRRNETITTTTTSTTTSTKKTPMMAPSEMASSMPKAVNGIPHKCNSLNNPPCPHCGTMIIPSPAARLPLEDIPSITVGDFTITSCKKPILNSVELDKWESEHLPGLRALPEMIFGNNFIKIENVEDNWQIEFNALDALKMVSLEDAGIRVAYSKDWIESKKKVNKNDVDVSEVEIDKLLKIVKHYDWTYTTEYKGTITGEHEFQRDDALELPLDKLSRPDPILYFDDMILYEDELADNGISLLNCKIRVMNERLLLLMRFFLNVDDVILRVYDTRVYVEFEGHEIIREFKKYEGDKATIEKHSKLIHSRDPKALLRDSDWVAKHLPLKSRECEVLKF